MTPSSVRKVPTTSFLMGCVLSQVGRELGSRVRAVVEAALHWRPSHSFGGGSTSLAAVVAARLGVVAAVAHVAPTAAPVFTEVHEEPVALVARAPLDPAEVAGREELRRR